MKYIDYQKFEKDLGLEKGELAKLILADSPELSSEILGLRLSARDSAAEVLPVLDLEKINEEILDRLAVINSQIRKVWPKIQAEHQDDDKRMQLLLANLDHGASVFRPFFPRLTALGFTDEMIKVFEELAYDSFNTSNLEALFKARKIYGKNVNKLIIFSNLIRTRGIRTCEALDEARHAYGDNEEMFAGFLEVIETRGREGCEALDVASVAYGKNIELFNIFVEFILGTENLKLVKRLVAARKIYGNDVRICRMLASDVKSDTFEDYIQILSSYRHLFKDSFEMFFGFFEVARSGGNLHSLAKAAKIYGTDVGMFQYFVDAAKRGMIECEALIQASSLYGKNQVRFKIFAKVVVNGGVDSLKLLIEFSGKYPGDDEMLAIFASFFGKDYDEYSATHMCEMIVRADKVLYGDRNMLRVFVDIAKDFGVDTCNDVLGISDTYGRSLSRLQLVYKCLKVSGIFDEDVVMNFVDKFESGGEVSAMDYMESLKRVARGFSSSDPPVEQRLIPEYEYLVKYVFPQGDYSDYKTNLSCGDQIGHLESYKYDKAGYPVQLNGLLGYALKDGVGEDLEALDLYQGRLSRISSFVASRGPDNVALKETFTKKVAEIFESVGLPEFKALGPLDINEQLVCLLIGQALLTDRTDVAGKYNVDILDLIVEYKYVFAENLANYVRCSADGVKTYKDEVSQRCALWKELSTIYGENVKHVLKNNIFSSLSGSSHYDEIFDVYSRKVSNDVERDLEPKQWSRISNTLTNVNIPNEDVVLDGKVKAGKFSVLLRQFQAIFGTNIKFQSDEQKFQFEDELKRILEAIQSEFSIQSIRDVLPKLFTLRNMYKFNLYARLEEIFSLDINKIFRELAKYKEKIEVESKEGSIDDGKDFDVKKSVKNRNIRGYFTKTKETANARMGAYLCIAGDQRMWKNKNYFELVLIDEDTGKCVGMVMLLHIQAADGKKYLWFGPNPFESFLDNVSSVKCYDYLYKTICEFAETNNYDGVVVPAEKERILGECTNRGGDFPSLILNSRIVDHDGNPKIVDFGKNHLLSGEYKYRNGALIWAKGQMKTKQA